MTSSPPLTERQEEQLARYRAGVMDQAERAAFEHELLASDALAEALYAEQSIEHAGRGTRAPAAATRSRARWAPLVAAAAVLVAVFVAVRPWSPAPQREDVRSGSAALRLSVSADGEWFEWTEVEGADAYRVIVTDEQGAERASEVVGEARIRLAELVPEDLGTGAWRVVPLTAEGIELPASQVAPFVRRR